MALLEIVQFIAIAVYSILTILFFLWVIGFFVYVTITFFKVLLSR